MILDLVPNHTSDRHPWFQESRKSEGNEYRNWYVWREGEGGGEEDRTPPTNWRSFFGGSAWEFSNQTGMFYLHQFLQSQPDLNWREEGVQRAFEDIMRFWYDKGIDGFRVDSPYVLFEDPNYRDEPRRKSWEEEPWMDKPHDALKHSRTQNLERNHKIMRLMRRVTDAYMGKVLVCETWTSLKETRQYYGDSLDECHMPWNFNLLSMDENWTASEMRRKIWDYLDALPREAWPNWVLSNHDNPRVRSRLGGQEERARIAHMLLLTLPGTPTLYYGDEIGMKDVDIPPDQMRDTRAVQYSNSTVREKVRREDDERGKHVH